MTANGKSNGNVQASNEEPKPVSQFSFGLFLVKFIVLLYDIITFPIFALIQRPWKKRRANRRIRAVLENPHDPYSAYVRVDQQFNNHYAFKAETIPESQQLALKLNPKDMPSLGYREVIEVIPEVTKSGKKMLKYNLTDYKWLTISEVDEKIGRLSRGFLSNGVKYQEPVLIFAETRMGRLLDWLFNSAE